MMDSDLLIDNTQVPAALIRSLFHYPQTLERVLADAGLRPHDLAIWARQAGAAAEIEKLAGWFSVGQEPDHYKPLLEVAGCLLRAGDLQEALPVFRWAYQNWRLATEYSPAYYANGAKLLVQWGACLYRLGCAAEAEQCWQQALDATLTEEILSRLFKTIERLGAVQTYERVLDEATRRQLPGAAALAQRWQHLSTSELPTMTGMPLLPPSAEPDESERQENTQGLESVGLQPEVELQSKTEPQTDGQTNGLGVAVMADVANLDLVCSDQYGLNACLDYGQLLQAAGRYGPVEVKIAFVPDIPDTLAVRERLAQAGFDLDLKRPKRSHGRMVANADTAMAAMATRWAGDPQIGRVELWTGDGDFLKVREVIAQAWPQVEVIFRSFAAGTAAAIQHLDGGWEEIGAQYVQSARVPSRRLTAWPDALYPADFRYQR
ncbi:MAG: NYN domain-containing protein [Anaerolineae bacterium]|nr:NYN domain-containing protein [Anaerolineae bacterium]